MGRAVTSPTGNQSDNFGSFDLRQVVTITVGEDEGRVRLSGFVTATGREELEVTLRILPISADALAPGTLVRVHGLRTPVVPAQVESLESEPSPTIVLRAVATSDATGNQRAFHRVPMQLMDTHATAIANGSAARFRVRVMDLSGGGARLLCPRQLEAGSMLSMRVPVLAGRSIEVQGRVMWVRPVRRYFQVGVQFISLSDIERELIIRIVFQAELRLWNPG